MATLDFTVALETPISSKGGREGSSVANGTLDLLLRSGYAHLSSVSAKGFLTL